MTAQVKHLRDIANDAAFLTAALLDPFMDQAMKTREVKDTLAALLPKLEAAGLMIDFKQEPSGYGLWSS